MSHHLFKLLFPLLCPLLLLTSGCSLFSSGSANKHYYQVFYSPVANQFSGFDEVVRIRPFDVDRVYRRHNLVHRSSPYELFYYNTHFWAVRPADMMSDVMSKHLKSTGLFHDVITQLEKRPKYEITGRILALDGIESGERRFARASMRFTINRFDTGEPLVSHYFDRRKEVFNNEPVYVVRALSELIEEEITLFLGKIHDAFTSPP